MTERSTSWWSRRDHSGVECVIVESEVIIVIIQPVLELTPVQVIQARPTRCRVSVTVCEKKVKKSS